jgi:hypothetical protein
MEREEEAQAFNDLHTMADKKQRLFTCLPAFI